MSALLRYALRTAPRPTLGIAVLLLLRVTTRLAMVLVIGRVVAALPHTSGGSLSAALRFTAALASILVLNAVLPTVAEAWARNLGNGLNEDLASRLAAPMMAPTGIGHLEDPGVADARQRARGRIGFAVSRGVLAAFVLLTTRLTAVGAAVLVAVFFSPWAALAALASTLLAEQFASRIIAQEFNAWHLTTGGYRRSRYLFDLAMRDAPKEIRVFGLQGFFVDRYVTEWNSALRPQWMVRSRGMWRSLAVMSGHLAIVGTAIVLATRAALPVSAFITTITALLAVSMAYNATSVAEAARGRDAWRSLTGLPDLVAAHQPATGTRHADPSHWPRNAIVFEGVAFRYPDSKRDILSDVNLKIRAGETLALVGVNGAGKSTLVKLLACVYRPVRGRITVDGHDLAELDAETLAGWQRRIAAIMQDFLKLPLSAAANVRFDDVEGAGATGLDELAERAGAGDLAAALPYGWETVLDPAYERGTDLSGGEWQRLALMRTLHAADAGAGLLILDEPAAALDVRAEAALVDRYLDLTGGSTSLVISHRYSVVRHAARICVLDDGRITEQGTHEELLAAGHEYARLFQLQAQRYREHDDGDGAADA